MRGTLYLAAMLLWVLIGPPAHGSSLPPHCKHLLTLNLPSLDAMELKEVRMEYRDTDVWGNEVSVWVTGWNYRAKTGEAIWNGRKVFLKRLSSRRPREFEFTWEASLGEVAPAVLGVVTVPGARPQYFMVQEHIEGKVFRLDNLYVSGYSSDDVSGYRLNLFYRPGEFLVSDQTLKDVRNAFDTLNRLSLLAHDVQFIITAEGRALLIDLEYYRRTSRAPSLNPYLRDLVIKNLTLSPDERETLDRERNPHGTRPRVI